MRAIVRHFFLASACLSIAACSGAGSPPAPSSAPLAATAPPKSTAPTAATTLRFVWPAHVPADAHQKRRAYVSPSIASLTISLDGTLVATETAPMPTGQPLTVTYVLPFSVGNHSLAIAEYDAANKLLGDATEPITVVDGADNVIAFTLDGELASIAIVPPSSPFLEGTLAAGFTIVGDGGQTFSAIPEDADGNRIIAPGAIPAISTTSAVPNSIVDTDLGNDTFVLAATTVIGATTITASGTNLEGATVKTTFQASTLAAIYVVQYTPQTINVYDENGTQLTMPASAFAGVQNPGGVTYVPASTPFIRGTLVITQTADSSMPSVVEYDTSGAPLALPGAAFPGTKEPLFAGYGVVGSTPTLAVPNENSDSVELFDVAGDALPLPTGAFPMLNQPTQALYDAHDSDYYVTSFGSATLARYTASGAAVGMPVNAGNATMGEALDTNNNQLYVAFAGMQPTNVSDKRVPRTHVHGTRSFGKRIDGSKPVTVGPQLAQVMVFDEAPTEITEPITDFVPPTTTAFYADIMFDPYLKELFVTDAGDNEMVAFTESGASVNLAATAFGNFSDPMGMAIVP